MAASSKGSHRHFFLLLAAGVAGALCMDTRHASHAWRFPYLASAQDLQLLLVCTLSLVCDYLVLGYHASTPPHPKFRLSFARRFSLAVHITSGCIEIWASTVAWFAADPTLLTRVAVAAAFLGHIPSAAHQLPIVFGVKAITIPCYIVFVAIHVYTATMLALSPTDPLTLLKLSAALHGYVWVRMSIGIFKKLGVFASHEYTMLFASSCGRVASLIVGTASPTTRAELTDCHSVRWLPHDPSDPGPCRQLFSGAHGSGLLFFIYPVLQHLGLDAWRSNVDEYSREIVVLDEGRKRAALKSLASRALSSTLTSEDGTGRVTDGALTPDSPGRLIPPVAVLSARELAQSVFQRLDKNKDGSLQIAELGPIIRTLGLDERQVSRYIKSGDRDGDGSLCFEEFYRHVWCYHRTAERLMSDGVRALAGELRDNMSDAEKAQVVFQALDCDDSGSISVKELGDVLTSWALPEGEAAQYMKRMDTDGNGHLDVKEFTAHLRPMWEYGFELLVEELEASRDTYVVPELGLADSLSKGLGRSLTFRGREMRP